MLTGIPLLHYFKCKNQYSGAHGGMRYLFTPGKSKTTAPDGSESETPILTVQIWPEPWSIEKTDPEKRRKQVFPLTEEGRAAAIQYLADTYAAEEEVWESCPGLLDCEPWTPPAPKDESDGNSGGEND